MAVRKNAFGNSGGFISKKRDKSDEVDLDITPMIDVTFLLLIFFMVTSTMQGEPDYDNPPARYGVGVLGDEATAVIIKRPVAPGETPVVLLENNVECFPGDHDTIRQAIEEGIQAGKFDVIINADRGVPSGFVQEVLRVIKDVEGARYYIGVKDPKNY